MKRIRVLIWLALSAVMVLLAAGSIYQWASVRAESGRFHPPGTFIAVSDSNGTLRRLHLVCLGHGSPTVIFEHSGFGNASSSHAAREEVSAYTKVCSYDRLGMGWSDPGPERITASLLVRDLEELTKQAGLQPPFVLVPASIGGITAELYARLHPNQIAGLVFVDAGNSALSGLVKERLPSMEAQAACLLPIAARIGILRLADPFNLRNSGTPADSIARLYRVEPMATLCGIVRGFSESIQQLNAAPMLPDNIPLAVLVHERPDGLIPPSLSGQRPKIDAQWLAAQQDFATRSKRGTWRIVPGSDHLIGNSQPHAVASAVLEIVQATPSEPAPPPAAPSPYTQKSPTTATRPRL